MRNCALAVGKREINIALFGTKRAHDATTMAAENGFFVVTAECKMKSGREHHDTSVAALAAPVRIPDNRDTHSLHGKVGGNAPEKLRLR